MRPIEFRVWHKDARMMVIPEKQSDAFRWDEEGQSIEIMQFTGLHDKNGVKIFEGDIVKWGHVDEYSRETPHRIALVEFSPDLQFNCKVTNHVFKFGCFSYQQTHKYLEVLGNIHKTPELLEK